MQGRMRVVGLAMAVAVGMGALAVPVHAQASDGDKKFLDDLAEDSNYEIGISKLALEKSKSADVKAYAQMVVRDHTQLKHGIAMADKAAGVAAQDPTGMGAEGRTTYEALKLLSGDTFDKEYIQRMVKGNVAIESEEKTAADSQVAAVKKLAKQSAADDQTHAEKAKALATAHNVSQ